MLTQDENLRLSRLLKGESNLNDGLQLYTALTARGIPFKMEWEEKILELGLLDDPERIDLLQRYRQVLLTLGKDVPEVIEKRFAEISRIEEYGTDHQLSADRYNKMTGMGDTEPEFRALVEHVKTFTMTSVERMYALYKSIKYIDSANIAGDIVECGVWRGGSMMLVAHTLLALGQSDRDLYLFDTFEGLPKPDEFKDVDLWGNRAIDGWLPRQTGEESSYWAEASLEDVKKNLASTAYPPERIHFVKGMVERTIPENAPKSIAILRLDTDWYSSTKHEMEHLYPLLSPNGVLIIDDYGHFKGAREAIDEYFKTKGLTVLLNRIDYSGRLVLKTSNT